LRIKEIGIRRYGPLPDFIYRMGEGIQPVFGSNETGKTLFMDAVLKMMTGYHVGKDPSLDRVPETPEGYIVILDDGSEIKIESGKTLTEYLGLDPARARTVQRY